VGLGSGGIQARKLILHGYRKTGQESVQIGIAGPIKALCNETIRCP
jgi:hypothetical protein